MQLVLAGQPNCGKSTIFNAVAGYRSATANYPGSSITYTLSRAMILGREVSVVDLPGIYSLTSSDGDEGVALRYLLEQDYDLIINVVDASRLGRSLELTLQLLEIGRPMVVALNMMDEARRHGIAIDVEALADELAVPVVPTISSRGTGVKELFRTAIRQVFTHQASAPRSYDLEVETAIAAVRDELGATGGGERMPARFIAGKLLEREPLVRQQVYAAHPELEERVESVAAVLEHAHGWSSEEVVSGSRHAVAHALEDRVSTVGAPRLGWRERVDRLLLHPATGGPLMLAILAGFFLVVFTIGQRVEAPLVALFRHFGDWLAGYLPLQTLPGTVAHGIVLGLSGGVGIALPYLIPFLVGLAILEDTGYLPRMAYILDNFMHRIGLHGKSVLPLMLGYGCSVPAIMSTRILETRRDRRLTTVLTAFIPCSARTVVIYGLVAAFMGPMWALFIYLLNIVVVVALGNVLARLMKGRSPGLILEIPELQMPQLRTLLAKTWLSLKEFITIAWPLLILCSALLGVLEWANADRLLNALLSPLTVVVLGLPAAVGVTLVFGVLRKELTLVMLVQALGTSEIGTVLTDGQLMAFTLFVVFYVPCVATVAAMAKELGWKDTVWISGLTVALATVIAAAARAAFAIG
jgi:ferrous iron transport protein B